MLGQRRMHGIEKHLFLTAMFEVATAWFIALKAKQNHRHYPSAISRPLFSATLGSELCVFV